MSGPAHASGGRPKPPVKLSRLERKALKLGARAVAEGAKLETLEAAELYLEQANDVYQARSDVRDAWMQERARLKSQGVAFTEEQETTNIRMCHLISQGGEPVDTAAMDAVFLRVAKMDEMWLRATENRPQVNSAYLLDHLHDATLKEVFEASLARHAPKAVEANTPGATATRGGKPR